VFTEQDFSKRLCELRMAKGISARKMSIDIGQNVSYINSIENGHGLPSMATFFYICDYFGIEPKEFFDEELQNPQATKELADELKNLNDEQIELVRTLIKQFKK